MMRLVSRFAALSTLFSSIAVGAQKQETPVPSACGPSNVKFDTHKAEQHPAVNTEKNSALVYVISELRYGGIPVGCQVVTRLGIDGRWLGANCGTSYLSAIVPAGEHHLCADWQSAVFLVPHPLPALSSFTAEPGKTYYFRAKAVAVEGYNSLDLNPLNSDEGQLLLASSPASVSKPKK